MSLACACHDAPRDGTVNSDQFNIPSGPVSGVHFSLPPKTWSSLSGNRTTGREPGSDPMRNSLQIGGRSAPTPDVARLGRPPRRWPHPQATIMSRPFAGREEQDRGRFRVPGSLLCPRFRFILRSSWKSHLAPGGRRRGHACAIVMPGDEPLMAAANSASFPCLRWSLHRWYSTALSPRDGGY